MKAIVDLTWLAAHRNDADVVIVDCRFELGKPDAGRLAYQQGHVPGAVYLDLERDLSGPVGEHGGRHPLPDLGPFSQLLGRIGIDEHVFVVAYDDQGGAFASRLWWMLKLLGHDRTAVLDRGFTAWKLEGYEVSQEVPEPSPRSFSAKVRTELLVSMEDVKERIAADSSVLIDSRDASRYAGKEEPIDPVAGHIPGAVNLFWKQGLHEDGSWKNADEQRQSFAGLQQDQEIIVYCGSGVTACPNVLALTEAGFTNVKLYSGSWSDWCSYPDNPVATGDEKK